MPPTQQITEVGWPLCPGHRTFHSVHQWTRVSPSSVGEHELPTYLLRQAGGRQFLKAIPECLPLVIRREEAAQGWGRITFFSFWLGGGPEMLSFFLLFFPAPYGYRKNIKDVFPALEEFIIWLGGGQAAAESLRLPATRAGAILPGLSQQAPAVPLWGARPEPGHRSVGRRWSHSHFFCFIALVLATVKEFFKLKASGEQSLVQVSKPHH